MIGCAVCSGITGRCREDGRAREFQPQNLKRPDLGKDEAIAKAIHVVRTQGYDEVKAQYPDILGLAGDLCRSMIIPAPGHRFIIGDFSSIEARVLAHQAGESWKLEVFRRGEDVYLATAAKVLSLNQPLTKKLKRTTLPSASWGKFSN